MGKFIIVKRSNGQFQFNLQAENGEIILTSEGYITNSSCRNGIECVRGDSHNDKNYSRKMSADSKYYFTLKAGNGEVTGVSEMYETAAGRDKGIEAVKANTDGAMVDDLSWKITA
jgi:uncharacterized protein